MIHEHSHCLCRSDSEWLFVIASDEDLLLVWNLKLKCSNRADTFVFEFSKPLVEPPESLLRRELHIRNCDLLAPSRRADARLP